MRNSESNNEARGKGGSIIICRRDGQGDWKMKEVWKIQKQRKLPRILYHIVLKPVPHRIEPPEAGGDLRPNRVRERGRSEAPRSNVRRSNLTHETFREVIGGKNDRGLSINLG